VLGGPVFSEDDPWYRETQIPKEFWKVVCYIDEDSGKLIYHAFLLSQSDLITGLERLDLDEFEVYEVPLYMISEKIGFSFDDLQESASTSLVSPPARKINHLEMVVMSDS